MAKGLNDLFAGPEGKPLRKYDAFPARDHGDKPASPPANTGKRKGPKGQEWLGDDAFFCVAAKPLKGKGRKAPNSAQRRKARRKWARLNGR